MNDNHYRLKITQTNKNVKNDKEIVCLYFHYIPYNCMTNNVCVCLFVCF